SNIPNNPISLNGRYKIFFHNFFPQGWSFFTMSPRNEKMLIYNLKSGNEIDLVDMKNSSPKSYFGVSRYNRIRSIEFAVIKSQIDSVDWILCQNKKDQLITIDTLIPKIIFNKTNIKTLCGIYIIKKTPPLPWAWVKSAEKIELPTKIIKINVICE
ncbi:MAG: SdpA family antimicrobial peptide system protein, partial [Daejeonella sp.]